MGLINRLKKLDVNDPLFSTGIRYLLDHIDELSIEEQREAFILFEKLIKGDENIKREKIR